MKIVYMVCTTKTKACLKQATSTLTDKTDMEQGLSMLARDTLSRSEHDMKVAKKKYNYWRSGGAANVGGWHMRPVKKNKTDQDATAVRVSQYTINSGKVAHVLAIRVLLQAHVME